MRSHVPVFSYGRWDIEVLDDDMVRLILRDAEPPIDLVWHAECSIDVRDLARCLDALDDMLNEGEFSICMEDTFYELALVGEN